MQDVDVYVQLLLGKALLTRVSVYLGQLPGPKDYSYLKVVTPLILQFNEELEMVMHNQDMEDQKNMWYLHARCGFYGYFSNRGWECTKCGLEPRGKEAFRSFTC